MALPIRDTRANVGRTRQMGMATLLWGVIFGAIGMGFFVYGKRQGAPIPLVCGIALMVFPYFIANVWGTVVVGALLMAIPYFIRL